MAQQEELIKKILKLYPFILFFSIIIFILTHFIYSLFYPKFIGDKKEVFIYPGEKIYSVAHKLEKNEIIRSAFYFRLVTFLKKSKIKAGIYEFNGFYNLLDIIKILEKGGRGVRITIPEGMTLKEIEELFESKGFKVKFSNYQLKDFEIDLKNYFEPTTSLEGFLAPDTYEFFPSENEKEIIRKILSNFSKKFFPELLKNTEFALYERLILASIVEKEGKHQEDFPAIAGVLIKRLKNNKKLEVDATLIYEKCNYRFCNYQLTKSDLQKDSLYNTYKNFGLPPTPISNPGIQAINAVNNPLITDYWYYLTATDGKAIFAKTFKEHQENIKKYLKK